MLPVGTVRKYCKLPKHSGRKGVGKIFQVCNTCVLFSHMYGSVIETFTALILYIKNVLHFSIIFSIGYVETCKKEINFLHMNASIKNQHLSRLILIFSRGCLLRLFLQIQSGGS